MKSLETGSGSYNRTLRHKPHSSRIHYFLALGITLATAILYFHKELGLHPIFIEHQAEPKKPLGVAFSWSKIVPSPKIEYHDCFDGFQCARLLVPMDYNRKDGLGNEFAIAIVRLPAKVPVTDPRYGGAVLINPGGPGGSGVAQALVSGRQLQTIIDADIDPDREDPEVSAALYFDIIGFDPRAVNNTTPGFSCFPDIFSRLNFELQAEADGMLGSSQGSLMRNWQRNLALTESCSEKLLYRGPDGRAEAMGEHVNTVPVARDMLEITERHAEWREQQGIEEQKIVDTLNGYDIHQTIAARTAWKRNQEKIHYWGRSYGTVLGATFAAMFPDRVKRVVLDGVVDLDKYYTGEGANSVVDADAIFDRFFSYCHASGPIACPFYSSGGLDDIKSSYYNVEAKLLNASLPVRASDTRGPEVITWTELKTLQRIALYQPLTAFPVLARVLSELVQNNGSSLAAFKQRERQPSCMSEECLRSGLWSQDCTGPSVGEAYSSQAILCTDADYSTTTDIEAFKSVWRSLLSDSITIGDYWASLYLQCAGWKPTAKWKHDGPYIGNTSHPLLFVSTSLDPVTPLASARKMSKNFHGSVVLEQQSEGHTTASAPSLCTAKLIRNYFQTGELPEADTICPVEIQPFVGAPDDSDINVQLNAGDRRLYAALVAETNQARRSPTLPL